MTPTDIAVLALAAGGVFFSVVGTVGVVRLPDLYSRAHATSKSDTLGALLALAAAAVAFGWAEPTVKVGLLAAFVLVTSPTATHAVARAAHEQGIEPWTADADTDAEARTEGGDR